MSDADLSKISTQDLEAELAKRQEAANAEAGKDWYFYIYQEFNPHREKNDETEDTPKEYFHIVHKRFWHRHHHLDDHHIRKYLTLPKGFAEVQESIFEYHGATQDGARALESCGYTPMETLPSFGGLLVQICTIAGKRQRIDLTCDTARLLDRIKKLIESKTNFSDVTEYMNWIEGSIPDAVLLMTTSRMSACLMSKSIAELLPPYPKGMRDSYEP